MEEARLFCALPSSILDNIGHILFLEIGSDDCEREKIIESGVPLSKETSIGGLPKNLSKILYANESLLIVVISSMNLVDGVGVARKKLNKDLRCRIVGSVCCVSAFPIAEACEAWMERYSPRLEFSVFDESLSKKIELLSTYASRRCKFNKKESVYKLPHLPAGLILHRPLKSLEILALAIEVHSHGLPLLAHSLVKPLADYWGLITDSSTGGGATVIDVNLGASAIFGELCQRLNVYISVRDRPNFDRLDSSQAE